MSTKKSAAAVSAAADVKLPETAAQMAREHPQLWQSFQKLGEQASLAGPLDARTRRLVHLAYAIAAGSEGSTHSHARRALADGIAPEELDHAALLAITTIGWGQAIKGLTWVRDMTRKRKPSGTRRAVRSGRQGSR